MRSCDLHAERRVEVAAARLFPKVAALVALLLLAVVLPARASAAYDWSLVTKTNPPATMHPGQKYELQVVLKNLGSETWLSDEAAEGFHPVRLGTVGPRDRVSAFATKDATWLANGTRVRMLTPHVASGQYGVFSVTFTAPASPTYPVIYPEERFAPVAEHVEWMDGTHIVFPPVTVRPVVGAAPPLADVAMPEQPCLFSAPKQEGPRAPSYADAGPPAAAIGYASGTQVASGLAEPRAVTLDSLGKILVADTANNRVLRMNPDGFVLKVIGSAGSGSGQMLAPVGVATTSNGLVYVADSGNHRIDIFTLFGIPVGSFGAFGSGPGEYSSPHGLWLIPSGPLSGNLAVADSGNDRIQIVSPTGVPIAVVGAPGGEPGQLSGPQGVAVYGKWIFVADTGNSRVQRFTLDGAFAGQWGGPGTARGCTGAATGISAGIFGVYVSGPAGIQHFTRAGELLEAWAEDAATAAAVTVEASGAVWLTETSGAVRRYVPPIESAPALPCGANPNACVPA